MKSFHVRIGRTIQEYGSVIIDAVDADAARKDFMELLAETKDTGSDLRHRIEWSSNWENAENERVISVEEVEDNEDA